MNSPVSENKSFAIWNLILGVVHVGLALFIVAETLEYPWKTPVDIEYSKWSQRPGDEDERCSAETPCFISEQEHVVSNGVNIGLLIPFFSLISGNHHLWAALNVDTYLKDGANPYRAFDYLISSSLMIVVAAVLFKAPPDLGFLFCAAGVQAATILVGFCLDLYSKATSPLGSPQKDGYYWSVFGAILIVYTFLWAALLMPFHYALDDAPIVVVFFVAYIIESFLRFPIQFVLPEIKTLLKKANIDLSHEKIDDEYGWMALSAESKLPLLVLFYFGVVARHDSVLFGPPTNTTDASPDGPDDTELQTIFILVILASIGLELLLRWAPRFDTWGFNSSARAYGIFPIFGAAIILALWIAIFIIGLQD